MGLRLLAPLCLIAMRPAVCLAEKPNLILVMADDQGWGDTGCNGHPVVKTPNLDAMADEGLIFDRFYAAAPVCSPTRGSVLTGRHPIRIKITNHGRYMRPQESTFAEDRFIGYAAWLDWPWKLHRQEGEQVTFELYNLETHPLENEDLSADTTQRDRLQSMQQALAERQLSVTRSLNGKDYAR